MLFLIIILAVFFAANMGGASFAASFAAAYGGKILDRKKSIILFILFVAIGSVLVGKNVSVTLGNAIVPSEYIGAKAIIIIFLSAGFSMFVANVTKIPQSTSLVTVAAIAGVGMYFQNLQMRTLYYFIPLWILLPVLSFAFTYFITGYMYPPRRGNFWVYEKFINQQTRLKKFVIITSCYNAFSVGTNNVANVVGPLISSSDINIYLALFVFAIVYGLGAIVFTGPLKTAGEKIVPLGLLTASVVSIVSGSLMIIASIFGIPQSFVMLQLGAIFAIATLKHGPELTFGDSITKKTLYTWTINPFITLFVSYLLCFLIIR